MLGRERGSGGGASGALAVAGWGPRPRVGGVCLLLLLLLLGLPPSLGWTRVCLGGRGHRHCATRACCG